MVRRFSTLLLLSAIILGSVHVRAVAQHMNDPGVPCNKSSSTAEEASCFQRASESADNELNRIYARVRSVLKPEERNDLMDVQRVWLKYRDLTCAAEYKLYDGGAGGPVTRLACLAAITQERIATLTITYGWRIEKLGR
jgi:uncharacterized protein YecT (DUF1311 family)